MAISGPGSDLTSGSRDRSGNRPAVPEPTSQVGWDSCCGLLLLFFYLLSSGCWLRRSQLVVVSLRFLSLPSPPHCMMWFDCNYILSGLSQSNVSAVCGESIVAKEIWLIGEFPYRGVGFNGESTPSNMGECHR